MTREEAIDALYRTDILGAYSETHEAVNMAIKALKQESCEDCISRQQAIDKMQELEDEDIKAYGCSIPEGFDGKRAIEALKALPSVQPKAESEE